MRLSWVLAVVFVVGCGSADDAATEAAPVEVGEAVLDEPAAPSLPADEAAAGEAEAVEVEAVEPEVVEPEVVEPEVQSEGIQIGRGAVEPAPRVHRRPRSGAARAPAPASSRATGGGAVYDIEE